MGMKLTGKTITLRMHKIYFILSEPVNYLKKKKILNDCLNEIVYGWVNQSTYEPSALHAQY